MTLGKQVMWLATALVGLWESSLVAAAGDGAGERHYDFYQPEVKHVTIHEGKLAEGHYAYNHMASVEWFDGRFHAVWGAHAETHLEGKPGQVNVWSTSTAFEQWSAPQKLAHAGPGALLPDPQGVQWQPNLLNYHDQQLWCVWSFNSKTPELDGLYLSTLEKGSLDWKHRRIQRRQAVNGLSCSIFASQNPVLLSSGRVLAPATLTIGSSSAIPVATPPPTASSAGSTPAFTPTMAAQRGPAPTRSARWTMPRRSGSRSSMSRATARFAPSCATSPRASRPARNGG